MLKIPLRNSIVEEGVKIMRTIMSIKGAWECSLVFTNCSWILIKQACFLIIIVKVKLCFFYTQRSSWLCT